MLGRSCMLCVYVVAKDDITVYQISIVVESNLWLSSIVLNQKLSQCR